MRKPQQPECRGAGNRLQGQGSASVQYGSAQLHESSSTRQQFSHEGTSLYAQTMQNKNNFGFGARLRAARKATGLTGADLGKGAGENGKDASKASVSDWENDRHYPKADQLRVICLKLKISADHLVFGDLKDELNLIQAENILQTLSDAQLQALLQRMRVPDGAPTTNDETRVSTESSSSVHIDTDMSAGKGFRGGGTVRPPVQKEKRNGSIAKLADKSPKKSSR